MQAIFWTLQQLGQNAARSEMMSPLRCPAGSGLLSSTKQESEATRPYEERSRESAVRNSLRSYSRTGDRASSVHPKHTLDPRPKDTPDNRLLFRGVPRFYACVPRADSSPLPSHLPLEEPAVLGKGKSIRSFHLCLFLSKCLLY